ncbi:hypothetical protein [Nostoc sp.]|uniref:hypothetical protein n=1 Tax=Nostoc sp. TaxID=1180 RepID=UPI002FFC7275
MRYILKLKKFIYEVQLYLISRGTAIKATNISLVAIAMLLLHIYPLENLLDEKIIPL